jgi:hypothetical protein
MNRCQLCGADLNSTGHFCGGYAPLSNLPAAPAPRGWVCPKCERGVSPFTNTCPCGGAIVVQAIGQQFRASETTETQ